MSLPVIVLGAGGHAKVLINVLHLLSVEIIGVTDPDERLHGKEISGCQVIGTDELLNLYHPEKVRLVNGIGSVGLPVARRRIFEKYKVQGFYFASVIHPGAILASDIRIGEGVQIMAGAVVQPGVSLGDNVIINTKASVDHDCIIASHVHTAPGATIAGDVHIGAGVHVGTGASIVQGVAVGEAALIGAGSLVLRDVPAGVTVFGSPAKVRDR